MTGIFKALIAAAALSGLAGCAYQDSARMPDRWPELYRSGGSYGGYSPGYSPFYYGYGSGVYSPYYSYGLSDPFYSYRYGYPSYGYYRYPRYPAYYCPDANRDGRCDGQQRGDDDRDDDRDDDGRGGNDNGGAGPGGDRPKRVIPVDRFRDRRDGAEPVPQRQVPRMIPGPGAAPSVAVPPRAQPVQPRPQQVEPRARPRVEQDTSPRAVRPGEPPSRARAADQPAPPRVDRPSRADSVGGCDAG
jgi:hypothetical protein